MMFRYLGSGIRAAALWIAAGAIAVALAAGCAVAPTAEPAIVDLAEEALTREFVQKAIDYYEENGLEATVAHFNSEAGVEGERALILVNADEGVLLAYHPVPYLVGEFVGAGSRYRDMATMLANATAEGFWMSQQGINPVTMQTEPRRLLGVVHDGLLFVAGHSVLRENVEAATKEYVNRAIEHYQREGLDATIEYYNSGESIEGQFYLFLMDANDIYLAHPIFPHLVGTDIKDVVGSDGQELGKEIAQATEDGLWVEYLWPHPVTRVEQKKVTWAVKHDGLIFASGFYLGETEIEAPAWRGADPQEYTVAYVERAIERYKEGGLESLLNYYNSVASFEGQWYLFATDADDVYIVHPLLNRLIGTDIKDVVGSDGFELGKALAAATEEGVWVEYLWPHPVTLQEVPKVGYAVRYDGLLFASGYYPSDAAAAAARTKEYVEEAIAYYEREGLEATVAYYNTEESFDGQWSLALVDRDDTLLVFGLIQGVVGSKLEDLKDGEGRQFGLEAKELAEQGGGWVSFPFAVLGSSEQVIAHYWSVMHDGLIFSSVYYDDQEDVPEEAR